jgi:hypothetical protein
MQHSWDLEIMNGAISVAIDMAIIWANTMLFGFLALKLGAEYFRYSVSTIQGNNYNVVFDFNEVVRVLLLVILLSVYKPLTVGVTATFREIQKQTNMSETFGDGYARGVGKFYQGVVESSDKEKFMRFQKMKERYSENGENHKAVLTDYIVAVEGQRMFGNAANQNLSIDNVPEGFGSNSTRDAIAASGAGGFVWTYDIIKQIIVWLAGIFAYVIKIVVTMGVKGAFMIGLVFGPLAIAMSIFFKQLLVKYLDRMLNLGFTIVTINILDSLFGMFSEKFSMADTSMYETIAFSLLIVAGYFSVFKITSWFIGATGMNSLINTAIGKAAAGAALVATGVSMAAGGAAGGGGVGGGASAGGGSAGGAKAAGASGSVVGGAVNSVKQED